MHQEIFPFLIRSTAHSTIRTGQEVSVIIIGPSLNTCVINLGLCCFFDCVFNKRLLDNNRLSFGHLLLLIQTKCARSL